METLNNIPPNGFYIHYKHDPSGEPYNFMYEVIGIGRNTEEKTYTVLYRPLYKNTWMKPADYQSRPFDMFIDTVEKDGENIPRFTLITDTNLIANLEKVRKEMYKI
jgi:hypothetical protein